MLHLAMPLGSMHGWGVCSQHLAKELSRFDELTYITDRFGPDQVAGALDFHYLARFARTRDQFQAACAGPVEGPALQAMYNDSLLPWVPQLRGQRNVGYIFSETTQYTPEVAANAGAFDLVACGSRWCEQVLNNQGVRHTATIIQGVDRQAFNPEANGKTVFHDRFVVFSGGKFELRKGQDIVITAFKRLADQRPDALLVAAWFNMWPDYLRTMAGSKLIDFKLGQDFNETVRHSLAAAGLRDDQYILLPPQPHHEMARAYKNSDVGLFPNRCEGGTNLVLMEYMACGKPAIAANSTGQRDVLGPDWALPLERMGQMTLAKDGQVLTRWDDPDPEEAAEALLWAHDHPAEMAELGRRAGVHMAQLTWAHAARAFWRALH